MSIQELGAIGELVGGVAVIATLIYLAIQIRLSAGEARREAVNSERGAASFPLQLCRLTESPENVEALRNGLQDYESLPPDQAGRFNTLLLGLFVSFVTVNDYYEQGIIPKDEFEASKGNFLRLLITPGGRQWWEQTKELYPTRGVKYVEQELGNCSLNPITLTWLFLKS
jgi:hypothetical protein